MTRITINPVFDIETMTLVGHDGQYEVENVPIKCDRGAVSQAKQQGQQANTTAGGYGQTAAGIGSTLIPTLQQRATNPTGYSPTDLNNMLVAQQESAGGSNATVGGEGKLASIRTRNAGGFAPALDEAARDKSRTLASGALGVQNANATLKQQQQEQALQQLQGLYGTDTSNQLKAMGLQGEDLSNQLQAGRQGWLQNTEGVLSSLGQLGQGIGAVVHGPCWIAAATFDGWEDPRTALVRQWLTTEFKKTWYGALVMHLYLRFGERLAKSKIAVGILRPLFMLALKKAEQKSWV